MQTNALGRSLFRYGVVTAAVSVAVFLSLAALGARQDADGVRVLAQLDGPAAALRDWTGSLYTWLILHPVDVGWVATAAAALIILIALVSGPRAAAPLALLAAALGLATWGQVMLMLDRLNEAIALYVAGFAGAFLLGLWRPLQRLPGFFGPGGLNADAAPPPISAWEAATLAVLTGFASVVRLYGLNEMPPGVDVEMIAAMLQSGTLAGIRTYAGGDFFSNSTGIAHFPAQWAAAQFAGASAYSLRLAAAGMGVACVPLFYFLVRRLAGRWPAIIGTVLYLTTPEQVYWSRSETTIYIAVSLLALITVHTSLWLIERRTWKAGLITALWMPFSRIFYHAGIVMFLFPIAVYAHTLIFVRGAWRSAYRILPMLAFGLLLWTLSLGTMKSLANGTPWEFINPFIVSGHAPWSQQGEVTADSPLEIAQRQLVSIGTNLALVMNNMTYKTGFSGWYRRHDPSTHPTITNVGLIVLVAAGLGYLLAQVYDPRAWALLAWIGIGLLPGVLSLEPADRRIALIFPALPVVAAIVIAVATRLARTVGRIAAGLTTGAMTLAATSIAVTSLASQLLQPMQPLHLSRLMDAAKPILADSDTVLYDLVAAAAISVALGNLDSLSGDEPPCFASIEHRDLLAAALDPTCSYDSYVHRYTLSPARVTELQNTPRSVRRVTFLLSRAERSREFDELLTRLYPTAERREYVGPYDEYAFVATTVRDSDIRTLHAVRVLLPEGQQPTDPLLPTTIPVDIAAEASGSDETVIAGGFLTIEDQWAKFSLTPPCPAAALSIDSRRQADGQLMAVPAGAHTFEIRLPPQHGCALPIEVAAAHDPDQEAVPLSPASVVAPRVADLMRKAAQPVAIIPGYVEVGRAVEPSSIGVPRDFGLDGRGRLVVVHVIGDKCIVRRYRSDHQLDPSWSIDVPTGLGCAAIAVAPDGSTTIFGNREVRVYDPAGEPVSTIPYTLPVSADADYTGDGRLLLCSPPEGAVMTIGPGGALQRFWTQPPGGPARFGEPMSLAVSSGQDIFVAQHDGRVFVYRAADDHRRWSLASTLVVPHRGRFTGSAFDGRDRILLGAPDVGTPLTYAVDGTRLLAAEPEHELSAMVPHARRFRSYGDRVFILSAEGEIRVFERLPS